jgi:hypothetical protein
MAAGEGFKTWNTGDVLSANDVNGYLMQGIWVFDDAADRTAQVTAPAEGNFSYLRDTNKLYYYTGSAWAEADTSGILPSEFTAKGDLLAGTGNATFDNLAVGANGTVLTADSSTATGLKWATAAGGGKILQVVSTNYSTQTVVASTSYTDTGLTLSITPTSATSKILIIISQGFSLTRSSADNGHDLRILRGATDIFDQSGSDSTAYFFGNGLTAFTVVGTSSLVYLDSPNTTSSTAYKTQGRALYTTNSGSVTYQPNSAQSTITLMEVGA